VWAVEVAYHHHAPAITAIIIMTAMVMEAALEMASLLFTLISPT